MILLKNDAKKFHENILNSISENVIKKSTLIFLTNFFRILLIL